MAKWVKGQSGNVGGKKRRRGFDDFLKSKLFEKRAACAKALVERLVGEGVKGDIPALRLICERAGGKPKLIEDTAAASASLSPEQARAKLIELLSKPEVRQTLESILEQKETLPVQ